MCIKLLQQLSVVAMAILFAIPALARPPQGFHSGPYLQILAGAVDSSFDQNLISNTQTARDQELAFGVMFGWDIRDYFGPFLIARYSTDHNNGNTLHMVNLNLGGRYTFLFDPLLNFKSLRILPFLGADFLFHLDALPKDPSGGTGTLDRYGMGPGVMGGVNFLFNRYVYLGVLGQGDFPYFYQRNQNITGVDALVYSGGWHAQWGVSIAAGVHF